MNWTRTGLKKQAIGALQENYWKSCFVAVLMITLSISTIFSAVMDFIEQMPNAIHDIYNSLVNSEAGINMQLVGLLIILTFGVLVLDMAAKIILNIFVKNPVEVGECLFMRKNLNEDNKGMVADILYAFDHNYVYHVKNMLVVNLIIFVNYLLFLVPGIIKNYQYRLVPYLLAEHADLSPKQAMEISNKMMKGQKKKAFLLDLSFIPWHLAGILSFGLLEIFYVQPYILLTNAALYEAIRNETETQKA